MTITRVNPFGFAVGDKMSSAQANGLDINDTYALDKRAGQTDTLASVISCSGSGRIVDSYAAGANANTTYLMSGANSIINASSITAARTYRLSNTGAIAGDRLMILNASGFVLTVQNDSPSTVATIYRSLSGGSESQWSDFIFNGTAWVVWRSSLVGQPLADLPTLAAVPAPADGSVRSVVGFGSYVFKTSATTGLSPFRVAAADATPGGWVAGVAYETTKTTYVSASSIRLISADDPTPSTPSAVDPANSAPSFVPVGPNEGLAYGSTFTTKLAFTGATKQVGYLIPLDTRMLDGATLASAALNYLPNTGHGVGLPARFPKLGVIRSPWANTTQTKLLSTGGGLVTDSAVSLAAYQVQRTLVFTPNQNATIDTSQYGYFAVFFDEAGTNSVAGALLFYLALSFTNIPDARRS